MKSKEARIDEFVRYHNEGDGECNNIILKAYADAHNLTIKERFDLCYFFAVTYCVESAVIMLKESEAIKKQPEAWAKANKGKMIFQSDRKYMKMRDNFPKSLRFYADNLQSPQDFIDKTTKNNVVILQEAIKRIERWYFFGRFAAFLFIETFVEMTGMKAENTTIDWQDGATATSGLMNVFGYDQEAIVFDRDKKLPKRTPKAVLDAMLKELAGRIEKAGGDSNTAKVETSLCAYRKFHKGSRYNGYYLDRMLEELWFYKINHPEFEEITGELIALRGILFPTKYLGEKNNWRGIRKARKKLYKNTGIID